MEKIEGDTIDRIIEAAVASFAEHGYEGARMDQIADHAKVNKATIYYHIGGKQALYAAVLHKVFGEQLSFMSQLVASAGTPKEQLRAIFKSIRRLIESKPYIPTILMREVAAGGEHLPEIFFKDLLQIIDMLKNVLEAGHASGEFEAVHPLVAQFMTIAPFVYYSKMVPIIKSQWQYRYNGDPSKALTFDEFADQVEKMLFKAIMISPKPESGAPHI